MAYGPLTHGAAALQHGAAQPQLSPQMNDQRNSIVQAMMNIQRPPPQVPLPSMPQGRPMMGLPQQPPPGAPPQGAALPQATTPSMPNSFGVPPQQPMMGGMGTPMAGSPMPQQPMPQGPQGY